MRLLTPRLILREWGATDLSDLIEGLRDPAVSTRLASVPNPYTRRHAAAWLAQCAAAARIRPRRSYEFAINKREGVARKRFRCMADGALKDECLMALLEDEWRARRSE